MSIMIFFYLIILQIWYDVDNYKSYLGGNNAHIPVDLHKVGIPVIIANYSCMETGLSYIVSLLVLDTNS